MTAKADGAEVSPAPLEDRDGDLPPQDDRVHLLHDRARLRGEAQGGPLPPGLPRRAVLFDRPLPRAGRHPGLPALADPRQGLLRLQGRARLLRRPRTSTAATTPAAPSGSSARSRATAKIFLQGARRLAGRARLRRLREVPQPGPGRRIARARAGSSRPSTPRAARWSPGSCTGARTPRCSIRPSSPRRSRERLELLSERHSGDFEPARLGPHRPARATRAARSNGRSESSIRPERFARLVTLAGMLIESAKGEARLPVAEVNDRLHVTDEELRDDIDLLNVVNFGGGTYVLYAELQGDEIEVDAEPYGDNFARPARLLPLEAKALVAAIDLFGDHLPQSGLVSARKKIVARARPRPLRGGPGDRRLGRRRLRRRAQGQQGDRGPPRPRDPLLQGERGRVHQARDRALPARQRPGGLVRRLLRPQPRGHPPLPARPDQGGRGHRGVLRAARRSSRRSPRSRAAGSRASTSPPPTSPASGSPPSAPAGPARSTPWSRSSPTAPS